MPVLTVINQKGGVGKTATAVTLGQYFASQGKKILLLDSDTQGNIAHSLGLQPEDGLFRVLVKEEPVRGVVIAGRPDLDLVLSDKSNEQIVPYLAQSGMAGYALAAALKDVVDDYWLTILDTPPSTNLLHIAALVAADLVLIPSKLDRLSVEGMAAVLRSIAAIGEYPNVTPPRVIGVLPAMFDRRTRETQNVLQDMIRLVGAKTILPPIPEDTKVREASSHGVTIFEYAPNSLAAIGYEEGSGRARNSAGRVGGYLHLAEILETLMLEVKEVQSGD